jgi:prolyl 4-hydroxylase
MLALWTFEGRLLQRDLGGARALFARAGEAGHRDGMRVHAALLASGTGGERDWPGALRLLKLWSGRDEQARREAALIEAMDLAPDGNPQLAPQPETLSEAPYVARIPDLLTPEECSFLAGLAEPRLKPALIFHEGRRQFVRDPLRNSDATGFPLLLETPAVHAINRRLARASGTDVRQGEPLQVLRYRAGQEYHAHLDAIPGLANQRHLTLIVYLNDDYEGGETFFFAPQLKVKGRAGEGLLFANALPDGRPDPASRHAGLPVTAGAKLLASRWIRQRPPAPGEAFGQAEAEERRG